MTVQESNHVSACTGHLQVVLRELKVYLSAILDNYMFRPLLAIFRLS